uniref:Uncharacterized protein n=1 Tax=Geospiza parvula TaxID=87175 RepID=A0A8C3MH68_GEOPR
AGGAGRASSDFGGAGVEHPTGGASGAPSPGEPTPCPSAPRCQKEVYFAEKVTSLGKDWHRPCLRCEKCNKTLTSGGHAEVRFAAQQVWLCCTWGLGQAEVGLMIFLSPCSTMANPTATTPATLPCSGPKGSAGEELRATRSNKLQV